MGPKAFASQLQSAASIIHETYRLIIGQSQGTQISSDMAHIDTDGAAAFADRLAPYIASPQGLIDGADDAGADG